MSGPVLGYPDPKLPYILDKDVSAVGIGADLCQAQERKERVITYCSTTMAPPSSPECKYCVNRREWLAVVNAI